MLAGLELACSSCDAGELLDSGWNVSMLTAESSALDGVDWLEDSDLLEESEREASCSREDGDNCSVVSCWPHPKKVKHMRVRTAAPINILCFNM